MLRNEFKYRKKAANTHNIDATNAVDLFQKDLILEFGLESM